METLRVAILSRQFEPGQRLVERELCELTGVSRTCVREALRGLESEHLITSAAHKGPTVAILSRDDAAQIYELRAVLESMAGAQFARKATPGQRSDLVDAVTQYKRAIEEKRVQSVIETLDHFYEVLYEGAGNYVAADVNQSLRARVSYLRATTTHHHTQADTLRSIRSFRRIATAARRGDEQSTSEACRRQVEEAALIADRILMKIHG